MKPFGDNTGFFGSVNIFDVVLIKSTKKTINRFIRPLVASTQRCLPCSLFGLVSPLSPKRVSRHDSLFPDDEDDLLPVLALTSRQHCSYPQKLGLAVCITPV